MGVRSEGPRQDLGGTDMEKTGRVFEVAATDKCPATGLSLSGRRELCPRGCMQLEDLNEIRKERIADHRCKGLDTLQAVAQECEVSLSGCWKHTPSQVLWRMIWRKQVLL